MRAVLKLLCVLALVATPLHAQINAGNALSLDGVDDLIIMNNPAGLSPSVITYEAWYKDFGGRLGGHPPVIKSHSYTFEIDPANVMHMWLNINGTWRLIGSIATPINQWHHVAGTFDGTTASFYFDGVLVAATTAWPGAISPASAVHIGHDPQSTRFFQGLIDEVRIWDHARTEQAILADRYYSLTGSESGLLSYYTFDSESGGIVPDLSGNGTSGILTNGAQLAASDAPVNPGTFIDIAGDPGININNAGNGRGIAWADYDNDGDLDLYHSIEGSPNLLFENTNGSFADVAGTALVADGGTGGGVAWADYDNDGDLDLYLVNQGGANILYKNNGGIFSQVGSGSDPINDAGNGKHAVWGDYNNDGFVDLYLALWAGANRLYHNNGNDTFTDVATVVADGANTVSAAWADYDDDGDLDLYSANAGSANNLYRNDGGVFTFVSVGVADSRNSHSASWGDYDNDGDLDLHVANNGQGDGLYQNDGSGAFTSVATSAQIEDPNNGVSGTWADYDNDGNLDLHLALSGGQTDRLFANNGNGTFAEIGATAGVNDTGNATGAAWADYDNDGDLDLYRANYGGPNRFYRNHGSGNNYLQVALTGTISNETGIGTRVTATIGIDKQIRVVDGGSGHASQGSLPVEFGLGSATQVDALTVEWPSGYIQTLTNISANQVQQITENPPPTLVFNTNDSGPGSLRQAILNANATTGVVETITFDIPGPGPHSIQPTSELADITDPIIIDGTTQPGYSGTPIVEIDGSGLSGTPIGLDIHAGGSTVRGLMVNGYSQYAGIYFKTVGGNTIEDCYLGVDATGTIARGNGAGVIVSSSNNSIINNVISGNDFSGIVIQGVTASNNVVQGNLIGTDASGSAVLSNTIQGIMLDAGTSNNTIGGTTPAERNIISGNLQFGVRLRNLNGDPTGNMIQGNYIGSDITGTIALPNGTQSNIGNAGVFIDGASNNTIGGTAPGAGNLISGNDKIGISIHPNIQLLPAHDNLVQGNLIGTDPTGTIALPNNRGVVIRLSTSNTIGGTISAARNVISGNNSSAVVIDGATAANNLVQGNYLGTDITGTVALGNTGNGVSISAASNNTIGGTAPGARNIISGNGGGIVIGGFSNADGNIVQGNFVGTDVTGTIALGNSLTDGISITGGDNNLIGGTVAGAGNVVGGMASGVVITSSSDHCVGNLVQGNFIGIDLSGTIPLGNAADGVVINDTPSIPLYSTGNTIGGTAPGAGNTIAFNAANGVRLNGGTDNAILGNKIFSNANLGIDMSNDGVTANDADDADTGPNQLQNYPMLTGVFTGSIRVTGTLDSTPSTIFDLEFFANGACDASGYGEGATYLGTTSIATDANGDVSFDVTLPNSVAVGEYVTATATDPSGNTSEFSQCIQVVQAGIDVSIADVQSSYATTIQIPVEVTDTSGKSVVAAEVFVAYDGDLITAFSAGLTGTLAENGWSIQTNIVQGQATNIDTIKIAMATDNDVLVGAGDLVNLRFQVADIRVPSSTPLTLSHVLFNDGTPTNTKTDGSLTIIGADGTITSLPATIIPRETVTVTVVDIDLDTDGAPSTDNIVVSVVNTNNTDSINLTLNEGAIAGTFSGTYDTEYGATANADALIQAKNGDAIVSTYSDALDGAGAGPTNRTATTNVIGGADGSVEITLVSQPGDPLYIQVTDADLNTNFSSAQTASVTVENTTTHDIFVVLLTEADDNDEIFFGSLPTTAGASTGTELGTIEDDIVTVTYDDVVTLDGNQEDRTDLNDVIFPWGDADDNDVLQAFDAAKILVHVLNGSPIDEQASNVDDETITSGINPFDASLVLQKRVGLIATFPVQDLTSENHPQGTASPKLMPDQRTLSLVMGEGYLSIYVDDRSRLLAGDLTLTGITGRVEMDAELANYLSASKTTDDGLRIVFAGAEAATGPGELFRVYGSAPTSVELSEAVFNNGGIIGTASGLISMTMPTSFSLHPNMPNPFNPETTIRFELPRVAEVKLEVFDILGQKVRTLISGSLQAGTHSAVWHGRNDAGVQVGNGVYLYQIQAGEFTQMRRMLLLK